MAIRSSGHFKMTEFQKIQDRSKRLAYADGNLVQIGKGSSRYVYIYSSRFALKVAVSQRGVAQNKVEVNSFIDSRNSPVITEIYRMAEDYEWLITELVNPLNSHDEFKKAFGIRLHELDHHLSHIGLSTCGGKANLDETKMNSLPPHIQDVVRFAAVSKVCHEDFTSIRQWGKTVDGRVVLLDYGLNYQVWRDYY